ncbi:hypothetical protein HNR59_000071 [Aquamicrobium lusatiense]|uniref:Uncharacterized protein n=1 Tax=Aquamicrobium lusatiense TaxID=89772 RepID=A0A7W9VTK3_9HYPH|nr:hypothetical protein [Aquamicrobium lusatiense]MBB6010726.1 hypothetical protein [Aquamicrobium lusatiense]
MEHIAAVLLIIGCSGDLTECVELPAPATVFETYEECRVERQPALKALWGRTDRVFGTCIPVDPALEDDYAEIVWKVHPDGKLEASVEKGETQVASNGHHP